MKKPIVVNLFGPPGSGKSTLAAYIFFKLKTAGVNAELITEFAKDKTWEHNLKALGVQEYVFGKQSYRMARCRDQVEVIVTDSPLPLSIIYNHNEALDKDQHFSKMVLNVFNTYNNFNYILRRVKPYNPKGRNQTEAESDALFEPIKELLDNLEIDYQIMDGNENTAQEIADSVIMYLQGLDGGYDD